MSLPPKCALCGSNHHPHQSHVFAEEEKKDVRLSKEVERSLSPASGPNDVGSVGLESHSDKEPKKILVAGEGGPLSQVVENRRWRKKNRDKYNEGQRELMRKRRGE